MDLVVFENNKPLVIDEFRAGRFDYVELASDVAETKFFQFLFGAGIVDHLARDFPTPRERELVPRWMYLPVNCPYGCMASTLTTATP